MADISISPKVSQLLQEELQKALKKVCPFGSVEIFVQNNKITQITARNIQKTEGISIEHM